MNLQRLRWPVVVATVAVVLAAMFGVGFVMKSQTVDAPLKTLYGNSPTVESYTINHQNDNYEIKVTLKDTPDLVTAYNTLNDSTGRVLKGIPYTITVQDHRNPALQQAFQRINLYVQEALATGRFADMADKIQQEAAKAGITASLDVDTSRVYVSLHQNGAYLYAVMTRPGMSATVAERGAGQ